LTKAPKTYTGEKTASSTNVAGITKYLPVENWISAFRILKIDSYLPPCISITSK
jgi:hypothetical protein